jgi:hypothetical protein
MFPARPLLPYGAVPAGSGERWPGGAVPPVSSRNGGYLSLNQRDVGKDAVAPAVESQDPVEDPLPVAAADRQDDRGDQREHGDLASGPGGHRSAAQAPATWRPRSSTFLRTCTSLQAKVTLPSPSLFANLWSPERLRHRLPDAGWVPGRRRAGVVCGGPGAGVGLYLHSDGCTAIPAADRPGLARVLRGAGAGRRSAGWGTRSNLITR